MCEILPSKTPPGISCGCTSVPRDQCDLPKPCLNSLVFLPEGRHLSLRRETVITQTSSCAQHFNVRVQRGREEPNIAIHEPIESEYLLYSRNAQKISVFMTKNGGEMKTKALARL